MGHYGALVHLLVRRWVPWDGLLKGLAFGCFLLVVAGSMVLDGNYEFFRYISPTVAVGLFALLYPLYGVVLAPRIEWWGRGAKGPPPNRVVALLGYLGLAGVLSWSLVRDFTILRDVFHFFG